MIVTECWSAIQCVCKLVELCVNLGRGSLGEPWVPCAMFLSHPVNDWLDWRLGRLWSFSWCCWIIWHHGLQCGRSEYWSQAGKWLQFRFCGWCVCCTKMLIMLESLFSTSAASDLKRLSCHCQWAPFREAKMEVDTSADEAKCCREATRWKRANNRVSHVRPAELACC